MDKKVNEHPENIDMGKKAGEGVTWERLGEQATFKGSGHLFSGADNRQLCS